MSETQKENLILSRLLFYYCELALWFGETVFGNDEHSTFPYYKAYSDALSASCDYDPNHTQYDIFSVYHWWWGKCQPAYNSNWNRSKYCCECNKCQWQKITDIGETFLELKTKVN